MVHVLRTLDRYLFVSPFNYDKSLFPVPWGTWSNMNRATKT